VSRLPKKQHIIQSLVFDRPLPHKAHACSTTQRESGHLTERFNR